MMNRYFIRTAVVTTIVAFSTNVFQGASINVPNASFETPNTNFVDPNIAFWKDAIKPWWYDESGGYLWDQLTGVFLNLPPEDPDSIDNCDGEQAAWLFAVPEVEIFQDLAAIYEAGRFYRLTVGVIGGGGNMQDNVPIEIRLYYRDSEDNKVTIGATAFTYYRETGYVKHFNDVSLEIPPVNDTDLWAGRNIGVQIISTLIFPDDLDPDTGRSGGFWDLDNVRLTELPYGPDFTGDYFVNLKDFAAIANEWLSCTNVTTDPTGEGCVDMEDMMILAGFWLEDI